MADIWDGTLAAIIGGIAGALAGVGATTITNKSNRTATRIEKQIDDIVTTVESLRVEALAYWSTPGAGDDVSSRKIINLWETLVSRVSNLSDFKNEVGDLTEVNHHVDQLFELITGDDFQGKVRTADQNKVATIRESCENLCSDLHDSRRVPNRWRQFVEGILGEDEATGP